MQATHRISLCTPSFQQAAYVEECLVSVQHEQASSAVEHIVVDGGSTDGSKSLIEKNQARLAWWCSERDHGQSDAINKGLARATGDIFSWLNSDDAWLPGTAQRVIEAFARDPELLVFGGQLIHRHPHGDKVFDRLNDARNRHQLYADPIINQPATFYRMDVVRAAGGVDPALRYVMDVELWWQVLFRFGTDHLCFERIPLSIFRLHEESKTVSQHAGFLRELASILHGLCERTDNNDLARVIAIGYPERPELRGIPANPMDHRAQVRTMATHFLLKWHGHVHDEQQFAMMQALHSGTSLHDVHLLPGMAERSAKARRSVEGTSWGRYRIRRKLKHLFG